MTLYTFLLSHDIGDALATRQGELRCSFLLKMALNPAKKSTMLGFFPWFLYFVIFLKLVFKLA